METNNFITLRNGVGMPRMAMSANWYSDSQMTDLFIAGMQCGVRAFDTAREYDVEDRVGKALKNALKETGLKREDIFVSTRISNHELRKGNIEAEVDFSLKE